MAQFRTVGGGTVEIELTATTPVYDAGNHREIATTVKDRNNRDVPGWAKVFETMEQIRALKPAAPGRAKAKRAAASAVAAPAAPAAPAVPAAPAGGTH